MSTALITGGNRGLGLAVAKELLDKNIEVIITARDSKKLEDVVNLLGRKYGTKLVNGFLCDVSSDESVKTFKEMMERFFQKIDLVINNAGIIMSSDGFPETSMQDLHHIMETNLYGPYRVTKACLPLLEKSTAPMVINVSSRMGAHDDSGTGHTAYRLSKFALNGLTEIMHRDLASNKIKVVSVCPGWVHTDMGGPNAPRTPVEGAQSILAPYLQNLEGGKFYRDGELLNW